jgi:histidinol phosphatase-like enzyme
VCLKDVEIENEIVNMSLLENHTERIFDFIFYSPCDPKGRVYPYANKTLLRKPNIGMLCVAEYYAFHEMHIVIEWDNSLMVGDRDEDKNCAQAAGVRFAWAGSFVSHVDNWIKDLNPDI